MPSFDFTSIGENKPCPARHDQDCFDDELNFRMISPLCGYLANSGQQDAQREAARFRVPFAIQFKLRHYPRRRREQEYKLREESLIIWVRPKESFTIKMNQM